MSVECVLLKRASQIARERGLTSDGNDISCPFLSECDGSICKLSQKPRHLTLYLPQGGNGRVPSGQARFFARLEEWAKLNGRG